MNTGKGDTTLEGGRFQRQNDVLRAMYEKAQQPENWVKVPQLLEQFQGNITTDLSPKQLLEFACLYREPDLQVMMPLNP